MGRRPKPLVTDAPWIDLTYRIIGPAMGLRNELGPGHREAAYHNGMIVKMQAAGLSFESEPYIAIGLADGTQVREEAPGFVVEGRVIVKLKTHGFTVSRDEQAQVIGCFADLEKCPVALYLNFGRRRLEHKRLFPPATVQAYRREKWAKPDQ